MISSTFYVLLLLPSLFFAFAVLATFYGVRRAYLSLSWIPITLFLLIYIFRQLLNFQHSQDSWPVTMFFAVGWTSLIQSIVGIVLAVRAYRRREGFISLLIASCLMIIPFIFRE
jgi:hypothetical protein